MACEQFLAGAGFAEQQHGGVELRRAARLLFDLDGRRAVADVVREGYFGASFRGQVLLRLCQLVLQACRRAHRRAAAAAACRRAQSRWHPSSRRRRLFERDACDDEGFAVDVEDVEQQRLAGARPRASARSG